MILFFCEARIGGLRRAQKAFDESGKAKSPQIKSRRVVRRAGHMGEP
jgi:hypothetical protein